MKEERKLTKEDIDRVRGIEGFPIAKDEDIIALSRPPYYTACPNPFIADFIKENGTPYDEATDDYHREPFAADVSEGKNDPIYNAHSYHTKVPHKAIMRYILHYTNPGDIVFDGFCGTGMTGVAAQICGCPDGTFQYQLEQEMPKIKFGTRYAIINDLSPAATHIAQNYNAPVDTKEFDSEMNRIIAECKHEYGWMYETMHTDGKGHPFTGIDGKAAIGIINYTIWSDVYVCPSCSKEFVFWNVAVNQEDGQIKDEFCCPHCKSALTKRDCTHATETHFDELVHSPVTVAKQVPVLINYSVGKKRYNKAPDENDQLLIGRINTTKTDYPVPVFRWPDGEKTREPLNLGMEYIHQIYTKRNLIVYSGLVNKAKASKCSFLLFPITGLNIHINKMRRYQPVKPGGTPGLPGTLFISSVGVELSIFDGLPRKIRDVKKAIYPAKDTTYVTTQSLTDMQNLADNSVDYMFTDPPFGSNINYSELNFLLEAWLGVTTSSKEEAIMSNKQNKKLFQYQDLMERAFQQCFRVLKPNRWMTVEFHNSQNAVWNAIQEALLRSGFIVADVRVINKEQGSFNQVTAQGAVKQDLIISAYKPKESFVRQFTERAGDPEMAWEFVRQHLQNVPIAPDSTGKIEVVAERQDYLLFDRMVAFHIMNGIPVPMDAHSFYLGLRERFIMRDGVFFLADQVNEYDERRSKMELQDQQLSLIISDEKTAIQWLGVQLTQERQSYSDIQPKYLQELHQAKFEVLPELLNMLKENFLQDDEGKWYMPNLSDKADLEKLRRKRLIKDFYDIYAKGTARIKNARTEAIRVGFDECWKERNYSLIVQVGDRLPETVLQEDPALLMYYDNAANRM